MMWRFFLSRFVSSPFFGLGFFIYPKFIMKVFVQYINVSNRKLIWRCCFSCSFTDMSMCNHYLPFCSKWAFIVDCSLLTPEFIFYVFFLCFFIYPLCLCLFLARIIVPCIREPFIVCSTVLCVRLFFSDKRREEKKNNRKGISQLLGVRQIIVSCFHVDRTFDVSFFQSLDRSDNKTLCLMKIRFWNDFCSDN